MGKFDKFYDAVDEIRDSIITELYGENKDETLVNIEPLNTYVTGILYPKKASELSLYESDESEYNSNDDIYIEDVVCGDESVIGANKYKPSSMGLSVVIPAGLQELTVKFSFGTYRYEAKPVEKTESEKDKGKEFTDRLYHRTQHEFQFQVNVPEGLKSFVKERSVDVSDNSTITFELHTTVRKIFQDGSKLITVSAVNQTKDNSNLLVRNECPMFQCNLVVESSMPLLPVYTNSFINQDIEAKIRTLLYSTVKNYAYGHGCSVSYDETDEGVFLVKSAFIPTEKVLQMLPGEIKEKDILSLKYWLQADRTEVCKKLYSFIAEYEEWKNQKKDDVDASSPFIDAYEELIRRIELCIQRLKNGVVVLLQNEDAWESFKLMNEAMLLQRVNTKHTREEEVFWYPFQLAYILQVIPDIVNPYSEHRNITDLLWFPTGGGKTEAYLGVAAFTIFFRRISDALDDDGVAVIMRYTLRLLTIQQFERAAALICACEYLRLKYDIPGDEVSIGLWIGSGMTPNTIDKATEVLDQLKEDKDKKIAEGNPVQITRCPWCGNEIDVVGYSIHNRHMNIRCADNEECPFHQHLPIYVVDEDIYYWRPTLLLSTIDKFARIAWVEEAKNLFDTGKNPPSLIIQDELHLISGSLGSLAGLYEIAVDFLCRKDGIAPKVIASTATVKNADEQIKNIYGQKMAQFPPNGITYEDTFFSHLASKDERPARTYIGVCENGGSITDLLIRIYAVLSLMKTRLMKEDADPAVIDQYYTIVGYFNAIRDLGSTSNMLQDRMYTHIRTLINYKFQSICDELGITQKDIPKLINEELTSRKSAKEIKDTLENLEIKYNEHGCYSYILASNMLSVGIDINRLGLMTVYDQPKSNSEYIQATSRVGRQNPGLVVVMYNPMRSRDKSHYEQFGFYHKSFYQYVEATSVTPFSPKAMEKALHCIFVAMVRLGIPELSGNNCAAWFSSDNPKVKEIIRFITDRIRNIHPQSYKLANELLEDITERWDYMSQTYPDLYYVPDMDSGMTLLVAAENYFDFEFPPILNSLRNVEQSSNIYIEE